MVSDQLLDHVRGTYSRLRRGMAVIALLLPLFLWLGGAVLFGVALRPSISAYSHAGSHLRDVLVGALFAIGAFLYLYKGEDWREDWLLNIAGVSAAGIAYFEVAGGGECSAAGRGVTAHGVFSVLFFVAITWVCVLAAWHPPAQGHGRRLARHRLCYGLCAVVMLGSMLLGLLYALVLPPSTMKLALCRNSIVFWVEAFGVWAFSAFWLLRTWELDAEVSWLPWRAKPSRAESV